jgi:hypothetical protein
MWTRFGFESENSFRRLVRQVSKQAGQVASVRSGVLLSRSRNSDASLLLDKVLAASLLSWEFDASIPGRPFPVSQYGTVARLGAGSSIT